MALPHVQFTLNRESQLALFPAFTDASLDIVAADRGAYQKNEPVIFTTNHATKLEYVRRPMVGACLMMHGLTTYRALHAMSARFDTGADPFNPGRSIFYNVYVTHWLNHILHPRDVRQERDLMQPEDEDRGIGGAGPRVLTKQRTKEDNGNENAQQGKQKIVTYTYDYRVGRDLYSWLNQTSEGRSPEEKVKPEDEVRVLYTLMRKGGVPQLGMLFFSDIFSDERRLARMRSQIQSPVKPNPFVDALRDVFIDALMYFDRPDDFESTLKDGERDYGLMLTSNDRIRGQYIRL